MKTRNWIIVGILITAALYAAAEGLITTQDGALWLKPANGYVVVGETGQSNTLKVQGVVNSQTATNVGEYKSGGSTVLKTIASPARIEINSGQFPTVAIPYGNVGVGTTSPTEKLEVNGKIKTTDKIKMKRPDGQYACCGPDNSNQWTCGGC